MTDLAERHGQDTLQAQLFIWKASIFSLSCFCGCAVGNPPTAQEDVDADGAYDAVQSVPTDRGYDRQVNATDHIMDGYSGKATDYEAQDTEPRRLTMENTISMVGIFSKWKIDGTGLMEEAAPDDLATPSSPRGTSTGPCPQGMLRYNKTVKLTSASFSFQVVCPQKDWAWRLYPKDFKAVMWGAHVSKEGVMKHDHRDKVKVGVGNKTLGDGMNLHVVGYEGDVVTVWMDVPIKENPKKPGFAILDTSTLERLKKEDREPKVWFIFEDKANPARTITLSAGDLRDIEKYRHMLQD